MRLGSLPPEIRISDPRLQSIDTLDVISILNIAARVPQECTEMPEPTVAVDSAYDAEDGPGINPKEPREEKEKNRQRRLVDRPASWGASANGSRSPMTMTSKPRALRKPTKHLIH